jgi:hypothetical protein
MEMAKTAERRSGWIADLSPLAHFANMSCTTFTILHISSLIDWHGVLRFICESSHYEHCLGLAVFERERGGGGTDLNCR